MISFLYILPFDSLKLQNIKYNSEWILLLTKLSQRKSSFKFELSIPLRIFRYWVSEFCKSVQIFVKTDSKLTLFLLIACHRLLVVFFFFRVSCLFLGGN